MSRIAPLSILAALIALSAPAGASAVPALNLQLESDNSDDDSPPASTNELQVGVLYTLTLTITNAKITQPIALPHTNGLAVSGSGFDPHTGDHTFFVTASRAGNYAIRAFDIRTDGGLMLHVNPFKFRAVAR